MDAVTYSLKGEQISSDMYYSTVSAFTDKVIYRGKNTLKQSVDCFQTIMYSGRNFYYEEGILELLILGVYWNCYIDSACNLGRIQAGFLTKISELRQNSMKFKSGINYLKGIFSTLFLIDRRNERTSGAAPDLLSMDKLLTWLQASGEFKQEVKRLRLWRDYLYQLDPKSASKLIAAAIDFAQWFQRESSKELDIYTPRVEQYLKTGWPEHLWQEDVIFCGQSRINYHLNMVGAEIMNRIYRSEFLSKPEKSLLIPICMRSPGSFGCRAKQQGRGFVCSRCTKECPVNKLCQIGQRNNLKVRMVPHESSIASTKTDNSLFDLNTGVIGVSCVLNLISGGWMLVDKGVIPQCVILDYCGCKNHWHSEGIPTCINEKQLLKILETQEITKGDKKSEP